MEESTIDDAFDLRHPALARFRRALRREDQLALDELVKAAQAHRVNARLLEHLGPLEALLLVMLLEEKKEVDRLRARLHKLQADRENPPDSPPPADSPPQEPTP